MIKIKFLAICLLYSSLLLGCSKVKQSTDTALLPSDNTSLENIDLKDNSLASIKNTDISIKTESKAAAKKIEEIKIINFEERNETVYIKGTKVNLREKPSKNSNVHTQLGEGFELKRTGFEKDWSRILYENNTFYVASEYLTDKKPVSTAASASNTANAEEIGLKSSWKYSDFSKINSGKAILYKAENNRKDITVCVNAGHGTKGGHQVKTQCHPDGSPKVTGGTTSAGATHAIAVSSGMTFKDGTSEASVTLRMAKHLKNVLLERGYDVLMIREGDDVQLDNIARTVIANNTSSCHIALHWDSTESNKGAFYMGVPDVASYKAMEPVASNWQKHEKFGSSLIDGLKKSDIKIFSNGRMPMDLTQTSYSTIPSIDIELGDKVSDHSDSTLSKLALGLADGINIFFEK